jgi:anti-anti-sigma factor
VWLDRLSDPANRRSTTVDALRLASELRGASLIVSVAGDLDIVTSQQFDDYLGQARRRHPHVILDLAGVEFMDTSSLAVIVSHWKALSAQGGTLALAGARYRQTKTLWITGLAQRLPLYDSVADAVRAAQASTTD